MKQNHKNLELYDTFVGTLISTEQRRQQASGIYLSLLSAGAAALGIVKTIDPIYIVLPAFVISVIWLASLHYFRALSKAKFEVIAQFEKGWEIRPFELEWKEFQKLRNKNMFLKLGLTHLEMLTPLLIGIVSFIYLIARLVLHIC